MRKFSFILAVIFVFGNAEAYAEFGENTKACLINAVTGELVFEKNAYEKSPMASTTKIMTALVALENSKPYDVVTMTGEAVRMQGSSTYAKEDDELYMEDALYGLMLNSGNDAAWAVAHSVSGSCEEFVRLMNERAGKCGARNTNFANPSGLPDDNHYSTAYDMAVIAKAAMENENFAEIVSAQKHTVWLLNDKTRKLSFYNHNKLLSLMDGCTGIKTGYTKKAGRCLVSSADKNGMKFIAVTLNDGDDWNNHIRMYERAFNDFAPVYVVKKNECIKKYGSFRFVSAEDFIVPSEKGVKDKFDVLVNVPDLRPPINKGEKVGYLLIEYNGREIGKVDVISEADITERERIRKSFSECIKSSIRKLIG